MRPLADQTILVTGATDGHGRALAHVLAAAGAAVVVHGRSDARGRETLAEIQAATGSTKLRWVRADLASLDQVRALAAEVADGCERLDALVNNAGIGTAIDGAPGRRESDDGYELRFAVNYLAGYLLTRLLLPLMRRSAPARIVNVASVGQAAIDFDDVMLEHGYDGGRAYAQSKLAQIMFTLDLAEELDPGEVTATCLHPATYMPTTMVRAAGVDPISPLAEGVGATYQLVADSGLDGISGRYFNGREPATPHPQAADAAARRRLRALSDDLCGLRAAA
jgi:NAD(P)-dependent dehydrogenase (short-subunit alcohol dehydrogenase family)